MASAWHRRASARGLDRGRRGGGARAAAWFASAAPYSFVPSGPSWVRSAEAHSVLPATSSAQITFALLGKSAQRPAVRAPARTSYVEMVPSAPLRHRSDVWGS